MSLTAFSGPLTLSAAILYLLAGSLFIRRLIGKQAASTKPIWVNTLCAVLLHGLVLYQQIPLLDKTTLTITNAASLVIWVVVMLFLLSNLIRPVGNLGALLMPIAATILILYWIWPLDQEDMPARSNPLFVIHLAIALLGYAFLALSALQALLLMIQDRRLQQHHPGHLLRGLPPIETMDRLLFQLITIGFIFLSLTIVSGIFFTEQIFGAPLVFNHHTVLAIIGWGVYATLLAGRWGFGWRGRQAAVWTLVGFVVLLLGYFGTKFVAEVLLN